VDNLREFIEMAEHLTHIDLSGLNLGRDELKELCPVLASCDIL